MNKLQVSATAQSPNGNYLVAGDDPDLVGHLEQAPVMYPELFLSAQGFLFYFFFMSLTQKTNSSKKETRVGLDYMFSFASFSSVKSVAQQSGLIFASIPVGHPAQKIHTCLSTGVVQMKEPL